MVSLSKAAKIILDKCMKIKKGEKVLIITDKNMIDIANIILKEAKKNTQTKLMVIPVAERSGQEPPNYVTKEMKYYNAILILTSHSLTHTKASVNAAKVGARIASMPGATEEMIKRTIDVNYNELNKRTRKLKEVLDKGKEVRIISKKGTNLRFSIKGRAAECCTGIIEKGKIRNLPAGEVFIAPVEGTANGRFVIDRSIAGIKIKNPVTAEVKDGYATEIKGKTEAKLVREILESVHDKNAYNIAEFGIGTNPKAKVTGNVLEDEKAAHTCHIAFGSNVLFGGKTKAPVHVDGVILNPTIFVDNKIIMKDGKLFL